jgi:hypothetical protein
MMGEPEKKEAATKAASFFRCYLAFLEGLFPLAFEPVVWPGA